MNGENRVIAPDWIESKTITIKLSELNATTTAQLIECLLEENEHDPRVELLKELWDMLTS